MGNRVTDNTTVVIGLGRFGMAVALELMTLGRDVLAVEQDGDLVQEVSPYLTLVVQADATSKAALLQLGVQDACDAVVAIGSDLEASLLAVAALKDIGVEMVWAKALSDQHADILRRVGADRVTLPEREMGQRIAHYLVGSSVREYIDFPNGYAITMVDASAYPWMLDKPLAELKLHHEHRISIVGIDRGGAGEIVPANAHAIVRTGDRLVIGGKKETIERFTLGGKPGRSRQSSGNQGRR
jgi:trk system potassium uptake protein TrkA